MCHLLFYYCFLSLASKKTSVKLGLRFRSYQYRQVRQLGELYM